VSENLRAEEPRDLAECKGVIGEGEI